jgi:hypothetical protein
MKTVSMCRNLRATVSNDIKKHTTKSRKTIPLIKDRQQIFLIILQKFRYL